MDEELKKIMGESYKENMTSDEINDFFKNKILGDGTYVRKEMADAEKNRLQQELDAKKEELKNKLTDDEKKALADAETQQRIKDLEAKLLESTKTTNQAKAISATSKAREVSGVEDDDKDFAEFINLVINDNEENSLKIAKYVNTLVEKAYENGKSEVTKNKLANMGNFHTGDGNNSEKLSIMEERIKNLAKENNVQVKNSYFK